MACGAGQQDSYGHTSARGRWPGPLAAGTAGPRWGRGSARASGALEPTEPTFLPEPAPESPGLDTLKLWCSLFLSVGCYAEATRITTKTADD